MTENADLASTRRLGLDPAPGGLCLVQDLANTAGPALPGWPDLLADRASAQGWLDGAIRTWAEQTGQPAPRLTLGAADPARLRDLRDRVRGWLAGAAGAAPVAAEVSVVDGQVAYRPVGAGAAGVEQLVLVELLLAGHTGALRRLKTCANPACGAAFHDRSRAGTRVWHDVKTCGNAANLRASRARRRAGAETG